MNGKVPQPSMKPMDSKGPVGNTVKGGFGIDTRGKMSGSNKAFSPPKSPR